MTVVTMLPGTTSLSDLLKDGLFIDGDWVESKDQDPNGDVRLIQLADVGDGVFRDRSSRFLTHTKAEELRCTFLEPGDILVARMPEPLGRACIFPGLQGPAVTAVDVCILRTNPQRVSADWLVSAINSPAFRESMQQFVRGTTRQRISRVNLGTLRLNVPDIGSQRQIADHLGRLRAKRLSAANHVEVGQQAVRRFRQAILSAASSGRLTASWRAARYPAAVRDDDLAAAGWTEVTIGQAAASIRGGSTEPPSVESTNYPVLRSSSVRPFHINFDDVRFLQREQSSREDNYLTEGDLLITRLSGSIEYVGNAAVVRGLGSKRIQYPDRLFRCRLMDPAQADYLELVFAGPEIRKQIEDATRSAAGHQRISIADIKQFSFWRPPLEEQRVIVARARTLLDKADALTLGLITAARRIEYSEKAVLAAASKGRLSLPFNEMDALAIQDS